VGSQPRLDGGPHFQLAGASRVQKGGLLAG
jgi:hypothetical protein